MKKCIIITSYIEGNLSELMKGQDADLILCADGGFDLAREAGITPDLLIGDFDSLHASLPPAIKTITFPKEKDDTDTGLCVRAAFEQGCREVLILGGLGGRKKLLHRSSKRRAVSAKERGTASVGIFFIRKKHGGQSVRRSIPSFRLYPDQYLSPWRQQ